MKLFAALLASVSLFSNVAVATAADDELAKVRTQANSAMGGDCETGSAANEYFEDKQYALKWSDTSYDPKGEEREGTLYEIFCFAGAYNVVKVFLFAYKDSPASIIAFPEPTFDYEYEDGDETYTRLKKEPELTGFAAGIQLVNPEFDPQTMTLSNVSSWRGLSDAWSGGVWRFDNGRFVLSKYFVDPTYEANLENPTVAQSEKVYTIYGAE